MDEYSPKRHDIAEIRFLCENLYCDGLTVLSESHQGWINDPTSIANLQLNDLVEHIAIFAMNYKIKHPGETKFIDQLDEYLDDTFMLFASYTINNGDLQRWHNSAKALSHIFSEEYAQIHQQPSHAY